MIWDDFVKKEELELEPGVIDGELVQALTLNTYLSYIDGIIDMGENLFPDDTADQLKFVMEITYMSYVHTFEGRSPEPDEIDEYMKRPENVETLDNMINLCLSHNPNTWPEMARKLRALLPMHKLEKINWDSAERKEAEATMRKRFDENGGIIEIL